MLHERIKKKAESVLSRFPDAVYHEDARMIVWKKKDIPLQGKRENTCPLSRNIGYSGCEGSIYHGTGNGK